MREIVVKGVAFLIEGDIVKVKERSVVRTFKKSGVVVRQHYDTYTPKSQVDTKGYMRIVVSLDKQSQNYLLHNLVAMAYPEICGKWFEGCVVHHIDHNPGNNKPTNLVILTREQHSLIHKDSELTKYRQSNKARKRESNFKGRKHTDEAKAKNAEKHSKPIKQYTESNELVCTYDSCVDCSRKTGFPRSSLNKAVLNGTLCFGYYWKR